MVKECEIKGYSLKLPESNKEKFEYPFEEFRKELKQFEYRILDRRFEQDLELFLDDFKYRITENYGVHEGDKQYFDLYVTSEKKGCLNVKCSNLFTACLMYGYYIPVFILYNKSDFVFSDGNTIYFDDDTQEYVLVKKGDTIHDISTFSFENEEITRTTSSKGFLVDPDVIPLLHAELDKERKEIWDSIKDKTKNLSEEELRKYTSLFGGEEFSILYSEVKHREEVVKQKFIEENPGVPYGSTKIVLNKDYDGSADGEFKIKTINNELWFIPLTSCCDFGEES